ncbi:MAG: DUF5320 domain-containing protein [Thermoleophilia bacterium]
MPRGDRTGPFGQGAMTGRAAGYCAGYAVPGFASSATIGRGMGGPGAGGWSRGGHGYRNRFYATGVPLSAYGVGGPEPVLPRDEEIALLKSESQRLRSVLETIDQRLAQIETV